MGDWPQQSSMEKLIQIRTAYPQHTLEHRMAHEEILRREHEKSERRAVERQKKLSNMKQERESEHTLWVYLRLADWPERCGIIGAFVFVFVLGYLCSKTSFVSRIIDLIREVKP